jgi:UDP-N-acetylmuramate--alanine ligase
MIPQVERRVVSYGFGERADVRAVNVEPRGLRTSFDVEFADRAGRVPFVINLPGAHNVLNALSAIAVAEELGIGVDAVQRALAKFSGIGRRLEILGEVQTAAGKVLFVDDYGHHPTEIAATLAAARNAWPGRRIVVVFQPHRYTRTRNLLDEFANVLSTCDALLLTQVYPAGEEPITGADGKALVRAVRARSAVEPVFVETIDDVPETLKNMLAADDVVLTLGAGSVGSLAKTLPAALAVPNLVGVSK